MTPIEGIRSERSARSISDEFLEASAVAVEAHDTVRQVSTLDTAATGVINRNLRYAALNAAAEALARDVTYNMFRERWSATEQ